MKKKLLPLAIGAAIAAPGIAMAEGPTVYGRMNVSYENSDYDFSDRLVVPGIGFDGTYSESADTWELNSNASRLGVKGSETINDNLSAFYQAEFEISVDDGDKSGQTFGQRDIFVGLGDDSWGAVQLGKYDSPLKKSQGKVDQFNDMQAGDISNVIVGENRVNNLIQYSSPKIADALVLALAFQPGEEYCPEGSTGDCQDGPAENFSFSAVFDKGMFYAAAAYDDGIGGFDTARLTGMARLDQFELGAIYQTAEESEGDGEQDGYILSAGMKLGEKNKIRFQYGASESEDTAGGTDLGDDTGYSVADGVDYVGDYDDEVTMIGVGFDHLLSKQTKLYANYIMLEADTTVDGLGDGDAFRYTTNDENNRLQFGVEHNF